MTMDFSTVDLAQPPLSAARDSKTPGPIGPYRFWNPNPRPAVGSKTQGRTGPGVLEPKSRTDRAVQRYVRPMTMAFNTVDLACRPPLSAARDSKTQVPIEPYKFRNPNSGPVVSKTQGHIGPWILEPKPRPDQGPAKRWPDDNGLQHG